jgi:hypothetical protein
MAQFTKTPTKIQGMAYTSVAFSKPDSHVTQIEEIKEIA